MVTTDRVRDLFADAQVLYADALEMLDQGRLRNAAEKAWGATKRATDALVLARTTHEPQSAGGARRGLLSLSNTSPEFDLFRGQYHARSELLHVNCFYDGNCEPEMEMTALIVATNTYIRDAERLAAI